MTCNGRADAGPLLGVERSPQQHADDEALGAVVEVVDVDDRHLMVERDRVLIGTGHIGAHEVAEMSGGAVQPAEERVGGSAGDGAPGPRPELAVLA